MSALLLPFATRVMDSHLVSPDEVPRGAACNCLCPGCDRPVIARQGSRGQLAAITPTHLATEWAAALNLPEDEIFRFLSEAGYILI